MTHDRLRERTLKLMEESLAKQRAFTEVVDCIECTMTMIPTPQGMTLGAMLFVSLKGPLVGRTTGNVDVCPDIGLLTPQGVDAMVRNCLEAIRKTAAQTLSEANGHASQH